MFDVGPADMGICVPVIGRVGLGVSLFVVGIRVVGGRHSGYLLGRTLLGVRLWV
jgi:hypothetical protein